MTLRRAAPFLAAALLASAVASGCGGGGTTTQTTKAPASGANAQEGPSALKPCSKVVSSGPAAQAAVAGAAPGDAVCLADGSYPMLTLSARKGAVVVVRAQNPGRATLAGATLSGANLTLSRFAIDGEVTVQPGADHMTIENNRISRGYFGVNAGPTTSTPISDTTIRANRFVGPFGEDAIRANRYHDGPDADPYGLLVEGNEFTGVRENGNHSDCFQSVWGGDHLYFVHNYLHDNRCQGLFVKDQPSAVDTVVAEDNLMVRNAAPCGAPLKTCGPAPSIVQLFGPIRGLTMRRNTIWTPQDASPASVQAPAPTGIELSDNVIYRLWTDTNLTAMRQHNTTACRWEAGAGGSLPSLTAAPACSPPFADPAKDDFRLADGGGVDWTPDAMHFGP